MEIDKLIDSTLLKPESTADQITSLCLEAIEYEFAAVCVNPYYADLASRLLAGSGVKTCVVVGFPLGASVSGAKACEAEHALGDGAEELDMVMNVGAFKSGDLFTVEDDIRAVAELCSGRALVKVILECCLLSDTEKVKACDIAVAAGADFVKTSTGFGPGGATVKDVSLLKKAVSGRARVKASGGIGELDTALSMIDAGAERIGTSKGVALAEAAWRRGG